MSEAAVANPESVADAEGDDLTLRLAASFAGRRFEEMPDAIVHEACRGILDWLGCALAGSRHPSIDILMRVFGEIAPAPIATVIGRTARIGLLEAAIANGQMAHVLDYDDTHILGTNVIHASAPILAALFAISERRPVSGRALLLAYATGFDAGLCVGATVPGHIDQGWHGTGTLGTICAGAAAARLLDLDATRFARALAIAGTQAAGLQQNRGTMCKSFHAGKAASHGVLAGLLAEGGFTSSLQIVEGRLGFARLFSGEPAPRSLLDGVTDRWAIASNGHKPYACGFVLHPAIDAVLALRQRTGIRAEEVERIDVVGHRHIVTVTGIAEPATGLQSKFSTAHSLAVALIDGAAGFAQYTDARATDPVVAALRRRVRVVADDGFGKGQAEVAIHARGTTYRRRTEHASGTAANPMSDAALEDKFVTNAEPVLGRERAAAVREMVWTLPKLEDASRVVALCG